MNKINCLIIDDEELARNLVENYANRVPNLTIIGKCGNPLEAMQIIQEQQVDLIFLDIQMPELTGVEFIKSLNIKPLVIFTTAYKEYALQGYELDVVDYLLKPFRFERFLQAVNKAGKMLKNENTLAIDTSIKEKLVETNDKNYQLVKADFKTYRIKHEDILYIESMKEYVAYHTSDGRRLSLGSLKKLQEELPKDHFIRIHKSFIINIKQLKALEGNLIHIGDKKLPIGASFKEELLKRFF